MAVPARNTDLSDETDELVYKQIMDALGKMTDAQLAATVVDAGIVKDGELTEHYRPGTSKDLKGAKKK